MRAQHQFYWDSDACGNRSRSNDPWPPAGDGMPREWARARHRRVSALRVEALGSLLDSLKSAEFENLASRMPEGREVRFFENSSFVAGIRSAIKREASVAVVVERFLDSLFEELRPGERFKYTEAVICLLIALAATSIEEFREVASVFASSKSPELSQIRRVAQSLLK